MHSIKMQLSARIKIMLNGYILRKAAMSFLSYTYLSSPWGSTLKGKNLLQVEQLFLLRVNPLVKGFDVQESKHEITIKLMIYIIQKRHNYTI